MSTWWNKTQRGMQRDMVQAELSIVNKAKHYYQSAFCQCMKQRSDKSSGLGESLRVE